MTDPNPFEQAKADFWRIRAAQGNRQREQGGKDQGTRGTVTGGGHLDSFADAIRAIFAGEGIRPEFVRAGRGLSIPGYFRPTKDWDIVITNGTELGALIELKSQVGSLGNNFNNRTEEAIGNAKDVRTAFTSGLIGTEAPFLGFFMVLEDGPDAARPRRTSVRFFEVDPELKDTPYVLRYEHLLRRLVREQLYDATCLLTSAQSGIMIGEVADDVHMNQFLAKLSGRARYLSLRPGWR